MKMMIRINDASVEKQSEKSRLLLAEPPLSTIDDSFHKSLASTVFQQDQHQRSRRPLWRKLRILFVDIPCLLLFIVWNGMHFLMTFHDAYVAPQLELLRWSEERAELESTYYHRICTVEDATATQPKDLLVNSNMTTFEIVQSMSKHGVMVFPDLLDRETAKALRETIVEHNTIEENFGVLSNDYRYSYGIRMEQDPIVRKAVHEISTNPTLKAALEGIVGIDPALCKFHAITSTAGAADQNFHWDVMASTSAVGFSRSFAPLYSLFIPLQDTTVSMGPTELCPGSHVCSGGNNFCEETSFQLLMDSPHATEPVWPATYGALMNQQTTHRGRAHLGGPDRVLFIIAVTPRPRFDHISLLETRALSMGGSFAMHRSQWGHTWNDLNAGTMYNPIKMLRSLGVYKPTSSKWGREWLMVFLTRMANGSNLGVVSLKDYIASGGMKLIPKYLHAEIYKECDTVWYDFFAETFRNLYEEISSFLILVSVAALCVVITCELTATVMKRQGFQPFNRNAMNFAASVTFAILVISGCRMLLQGHVASRPWARHIRNGKLYTLPHSFQGPDSPSTLPLRSDVIMLDDFQSEYLASYADIYNIGHPGNAIWRARVDDSTVGYDKLPPCLMKRYIDDLLRWLQVERKGRLLQKNRLNQWSEMDSDASKLFVQKELLQHSRDDLRVLFRELAYRRSELKFGTWRDTALARSHIPKLLNALEARLVGGYDSCDIRKKPHEHNASMGPSYFLASKLSIDQIANMRHSPKLIRTPLSEHREPVHEFRLRVGDRVDALYDESEPYWYPGTIVGALAHSSKWVVAFDNDYGTRNICSYCISKMKPLSNGDIIELFDDGRFCRAELVDSTKDPLMFVTNDGPIEVSLSQPITYRRFQAKTGELPTDFAIGSPVFAAYYDKTGKTDGVRHAAVIVSHNKASDTFGVAYADGYKDVGLSPKDLKLMAY